MERIRYPEHLVFGLDIGTRSVVGTVGYKENKGDFKVVAHVMKEHDTRAMMDGQIHDIHKVAETIQEIKEQLESTVGVKLHDVCIAAAGRVLKTITVKADYEFPNDTVIMEEHIHSLNLMGVEKAYDVIRQTYQTEGIHFYCVGYSVIRYYINDYAISSLEGHKAGKISTELLATFLPEEVIDGLYAAVERAGLYVANLTLEPIAAIQVAIPDKFRLLNIALVDVGAGTSDICITKDGSIIAYGMIPYAGDEITEQIANQYLVDFNTAEKIKTSCEKRKSVTYKDIMGISHKLTKEQILDTVSQTVESITSSISSKIIQLNGGKPVSAVFIVGGGGKIPEFDVKMAKYLGIAQERVALRGAEVLKEIEFLQGKVKKDSLLVTPVGICLSFYEQKNNFIFVYVNEERIKLYDNNKLTIMDAAIQVGFPREGLFPQRGKSLSFTVDKKKKIIRGEPGEAAVIKQNEKIVGLSSPISQNDKIEIIASTIGSDGEMEVSQLSEFNGVLEFIFNGQTMICPRFVQVNGELVSGFYKIEEGDNVEILNYYTLDQVLTFMDFNEKGQYYVNHVLAEMGAKIYDKFTIDFVKMEEEVADTKVIEQESNQSITVLVNKEKVTLSGKKSYIFVDIFDFYPFGLTVVRGSGLVTMVNGIPVEFTHKIIENDVIEIYWKE